MLHLSTLWDTHTHAHTHTHVLQAKYEGVVLHLSTLWDTHTHAHTTHTHTHTHVLQAKYEGVVLHLSTLWDTYFPGGKDHRLDRCSATQIPYLQGDYWPGLYACAWRVHAFVRAYVRVTAAQQSRYPVCM